MPQQPVCKPQGSDTIDKGSQSMSVIDVQHLLLIVPEHIVVTDNQLWGHVAQPSFVWGLSSDLTQKLLFGGVVWPLRPYGAVSVSPDARIPTFDAQDDKMDLIGKIRPNAELY